MTCNFTKERTILKQVYWKFAENFIKFFRIAILWNMCGRLLMKIWWCRRIFAIHCMKSVQIRIFFWSVFSRIRAEYGKKNRPKKTPYLGNFHAVIWQYATMQPCDKHYVYSIIYLMDFVQNWIFITSCYIYSRLLMILCSN